MEGAEDLRVEGAEDLRVEGAEDFRVEGSEDLGAQAPGDAREGQHVPNGMAYPVGSR